MLMGTFPAASKPLSPFLSFHRLFLSSCLFCAYLPLSGVVPEHSIPLLLSCNVTFHLSASVYLFFLPFLSGSLSSSVELDEWSRWTVSSTSSAGCGGTLLAVWVLFFLLSFSLTIVVYMRKPPSNANQNGFLDKS